MLRYAPVRTDDRDPSERLVVRFLLLVFGRHGALFGALCKEVIPDGFCIADQAGVVILF